MSQQALEAMIGRAILDYEFRTTLFAEPGVALAAYELTEPEEAKIRSVDAESLDACAAILKQRWAVRPSRAAL